jgi:hypothetical protein
MSKELEKLTAKLSELTGDLHDDELKERLEEYIELKKVEELLLKEIIKLQEAQEKTEKYAKGLTSDLQALQDSADAEEVEKIEKIVSKLKE